MPSHKIKFSSGKITSIWIIIILLLSGIAGFTLYTIQHQPPKPQHKKIETSHSPITFVSQLKTDKDAGRKIFLEFCVSCHGKYPVIDVNAPRINDKKIWTNLKKVGMSTLLKLTIDGVGAMPARGGCFECSDEQLEEAIKYILQY